MARHAKGVVNKTDEEEILKFGGKVKHYFEEDEKVFFGLFVLFLFRRMAFLIINS